MRRCGTQKAWLLGAGITAVLLAGSGCESDSGNPRVGRVAVFSAFPAELAPLLAEAMVERTEIIDVTSMSDGDVIPRTFRVGTLAGVPVVFGLTGIGIANADATSDAVLDRFPDVVGVVFSGVAGSSLRIGDVAAAKSWVLSDEPMTYACDPGWLEVAEAIAAPGVAALHDCTQLPNDPATTVCLTVPPVIAVGGIGQSSGFEDQRVGCQPDGGDVFGCDVPAISGTSASAEEATVHPYATLAEDAPVSEDMETAAVARQAARRGLRFIAFRAVSDGAGDPLGLPGFPTQFFAYYRLAAENAAGATIAFLDHFAHFGFPGD